MSATTPSASGSVTGKAPRILACVLCQHRKIKCDRSFPCANCQRANVQCTPSTPAPARKRRRPNQDLQERLARCEELLKEYANEGKSEPGGSSSKTTPTKGGSQSPPRGEEPLPDWNRHGKLIHEDGSVRFVDSYMLSTIYDELRAMRDIIDNDENSPEDDTSESMTPDTNADMLFGGETPQAMGSTHDLQPSPSHIFRLWQVFLDRVNPLIKLVHVPTIQPYLVEATSGSQLPKNIEALLFSIYTLSVVALGDAECQSLLGYSREAALQRFSAGVRLSLTRIGFLKTHDLTTLQALVHYLISLQGRYNRHAAWVLNGVVIRIAQKMGLHRDGTTLGLPPFETEMRRRLWFQIISVDVKTALMSGLGHSLLPRVWDTQEPKNVNDVDLHPSATEPVKDREGPTEMIFVLLTNKLARFIVDTPGLEPVFLYDEENAERLPGAPSRETILEFRSSLEGLAEALIGLLHKNCDPAAGTLHQFTMDFKGVIMQHGNEMVQPDRDSRLSSHKDYMFRMALQSLEKCVTNYLKSSHSPFLWFLRLQFHTELFVFLAGQLCQKPSGPLVDRAWEAVENIFRHHPEFLKVNSSKENMLLGSCLVKAWNIREEYYSQQLGITLPVPAYMEQLRSVVPQDYVKTENNSPAQMSQVPRASSHSGENGSKFLGGAAGSMDPTFDEFIGDYLEGSDWDVFSSMSVAPSDTPGMPVADATSANHFHHNSGAVNGIAVDGIDHNDPGHPLPLFASFNMGPPTSWS